MIRYHKGFTTLELAYSINQARAAFNTALAFGDEDAYDIAVNDLLHLQLLTDVLFFEETQPPVFSFLS